MKSCHLWKTLMDLEGIYYAKWNKSERKIDIIWCHLYVESKNKTKQRKTDS